MYLMIYMPNLGFETTEDLMQDTGTVLWACYVAHGCVFSTVATDAMVLKHQAISNHSAD